ncbi:glycosyltransferase [Mycolicibacterium agri]|nr:glycosyltransferase [Mycolicibacterium agri]
MWRFEASPRRATPKGQQSFISCTAPHQKLYLHRTPSHVRDTPDGETGLLVQPDEPQALADALNALARDQERAEAMGKAGRQRAISEFDWASIALQTAKLYHAVANSAAKPVDG